jgi:hypothetical protein
VVHIGDISKLGSFATAMWADSLYFLHVILASTWIMSKETRYRNVIHQRKYPLEVLGRRWLKQFILRGYKLAARTPHGLSFFSGQKVFTPHAVTKFSDLFETAQELIKHAPNRLYNCRAAQSQRSVPFLPFQTRSTGSRSESVPVIISSPYKINIQAPQRKK